MQDELKRFCRQFKFKRYFAGYIGIEREHFLVSPDGIYVPKAKEFLARINDTRWTYELSACQVESRTTPHKDLKWIERELRENEAKGNFEAVYMGLQLINAEVGDPQMPHDLYPDPRYLNITKKASPEMVHAGCRVAGTHIHIGVRNMAHAIRVYNALIPHLDTFCYIGDHSNGERLRLYRAMAKYWKPEPLKNREHFFEIAKEQGFTDNPRNCWQLIRISQHGTVELRMFGTAKHIEEIMGWIQIIQTILNASMAA
ncbi:MAG: hypothetical protein HYT37_02365 [Candidatus Sungbacteria bacterium]|nr:hypothetical protein [Candidatus Sungbacteria bacterium]